MWKVQQSVNNISVSCKNAQVGRAEQCLTTLPQRMSKRHKQAQEVFVYFNNNNNINHII